MRYSKSITKADTRAYARDAIPPSSQTKQWHAFRISILFSSGSTHTKNKLGFGTKNEKGTNVVRLNQKDGTKTGKQYIVCK